MKEPLKQAGIIGIIIYVLSLPIMLWKSSKLGKIVFVFLILTMVATFSGKFFDKGIGFYKQSKFVQLGISEHKKIIKFYESTNKQIDLLRKGLSDSKENLESFDNALYQAIKETRKNVEDEMKQELTQKIAALDYHDKIKEIEYAISLVKEEERQALKDKIIEIRELVKIHKKSIDSIEIRSICERVADKMYLLDKDEKSRMFEDLRQIVFTVDKVSEDVTNISVRSEQNLEQGVYGNTGPTYAFTSDTMWGYNQRQPQIIIINNN